MTTTTKSKATRAEAAPEAEEAPRSLSEDEKQKALNESYAAATKALRERHREEFIELRKAEAKARGVEWTPTPTKEEKAAAELERIYTEFPHLRPPAGA